MKCPKCSYISYDMPERCRNCGYDFPPVSVTEPVDLDLRSDRDAGPAPDFPLSPARELPLFGDAPDSPLVTPSLTPRSPLAVRRSPTDQSRQRPVPKRDRRANPTRTPPPPVIVTPAVAPTRAEAAPMLATSAPALDPASPLELLPAGDLLPPDVAEPAEPGASASLAVGDAAPPLRRLAAAVLDFLIIALIDLAVIRLTLAVIAAPWSAVTSLRWLPLCLFFTLLNGGYLVAFTVASGQTIGKMLMGVRVVGEASLRVPVAQAVVRASVLALAVAPFGLGYLPALVTRSARGIHDRLSNTRVIRA